MKLWLWFIVSTFGAVALNIPQSIGISLIVGFLTTHSLVTPDDGKTQAERMVEHITASIIFYTIILISGLITKQFL